MDVYDGAPLGLPVKFKDTPLPRCECSCGCRRVLPRGFTKCPWCLIHKPTPTEETSDA